MLRGQDSNLRPPAYEAGELPTATTPRYYRLHYRLVCKPIKGLFYPFLLWNLLPHSPFGTCREVIQISFMLVCLTLKRNVSISVPFLKETHNPFQQIYYVEQDISKLFHLGDMDSFVIEHNIVDVTLCTSDKQIPKRLIARNPLNGTMLL